MDDLLTADAFTREGIERLLSRAAEFRAGRVAVHPGRVVGLAFSEESLRTRVGFEVAAARLGATAVAFGDARRSDAQPVPEALADAVRSVGDWFDVLCIRHPDPAWPSAMGGATSAAVVNCGNGAVEHPTQALIDLYAVLRHHRRLDDLDVVIVGNLGAMRCARSLVLAMSRFRGVRLRAVAPPGLEFDRGLVGQLTERGVTVEETAELTLDGADVVYVAGLPATTPRGLLSRVEQAEFAIDRERAARLPSGALILCPLPRFDEIDRAVDELPQARYFDQARRGLDVRLAVLDELLTARATS